MNKLRWLPAICLALLFSTESAHAQHLWWNTEQQNNASCLYGEITVLATSRTTYFCGANWHPGEPAGGYCGIQDNIAPEERTIFSIWDTSPQLHPQVTEADPQTHCRRFGGEGEGGHTDMLLNWKLGETFRFFVQKQPGLQSGTTDARYYIFDRATQKWRHLATINCPNGGQQSVGTIGGSINSFLENYGRKTPEEPRLAIYRLWLGPTVRELKCLTKAHGDGTWGELGDAYFLASGSSDKLNSVFSGLDPKYGKALFSEKGEQLSPITNQPVPQDVIDAMTHPPVAPKI